METDRVGGVLTEALIENLEDIWAIEAGILQPGEARRLAIHEAIVDTDTTLLSLPTGLIKQLGLSRVRSKRVTSRNGPTTTNIYDPVRLTIQGRSCTMDVMEVPDTVPVLIGQLPLAHLDFVIDLRDRKLIGNPAHGGEHIYELY